MKKFFLILVFTSLIPFVKSQSLPNSGFENWTNKLFYSNPDIYASTNLNLFVGGASPNVTRVTDAKSGSYAVRLTNVKVGQDTMFGGLFLGNPAQGGLTGGYPFDQRPDSFGLFYKSQYSAIDTGMIVLFFKKAGDVIGVAGLSLTGSHSSYTRICSAITYFDIVQPDSIAMIMFSSSPDMKMNPGSYLQLDSLFLTGATKKLPNHSFETWVDLKSDEPDGWLSSNSFLSAGNSPNVVKSTEKHGGSYSVKITTAQAGFGENTGFITNGNLSGEDGPAGGTPVNANPQKLSFYYKYTPVGSDTGIVLAATTRWNSAGDSTEKLEKHLVKLTPATVWTLKEVTFTHKNFATKADTLLVAFAPSDLENNQAGSRIGSVLMVDDLTLTYYPNSIKKVSMNFMQAWPVPASSYLNLNIDGYAGSDAVLKIYSMGGLLVTETKIEVKDGRAILNVSNLLNGSYITMVSQEGKDWRIPFIVAH